MLKSIKPANEIKFSVKVANETDKFIKDIGVKPQQVHIK